MVHTGLLRYFEIRLLLVALMWPYACHFEITESGHGLPTKVPDQSPAKETSNETAIRERGAGLSRQRRATFAWPLGSVLVLDIFINLVAQSPEGTFFPAGITVRTDIQLPNVTFLEGRSLRDRLNVLGTVEALFDHFGLDGRSCVLRAVCERYEFHVVVDCIVGEVLNLLLRFSTSANDISAPDYLEAKDYGTSDGACGAKYRQCPFSIFRFLEKNGNHQRERV